LCSFFTFLLPIFILLNVFVVYLYITTFFRDFVIFCFCFLFFFFYVLCFMFYLKIYFSFFIIFNCQCLFSFFLLFLCFVYNLVVVSYNNVYCAAAVAAAAAGVHTVGH